VTHAGLPSPELSLAGRVAIVTGASRTIGRATAVVLAEWGAAVALAARDADALEPVAAEIAGPEAGASPRPAMSRRPVTWRSSSRCAGTG
jgi:NAD(P)-dependent dehydrogenase (short-subunit alcohol dehydrogenase family)